jgi:hypothetical protein
VQGTIPIWGSIDYHPLCSWAVPLTAVWSAPGDASILGIQLGLAFQPNHDCDRERSTAHGL